MVLFSVIGGYLLEHGNISVLIQPAKMLIIGGAAFRSLVIASPPKVMFKILKSSGKLLGRED
jgi:chemotaxis protein MotA